MCVYGTARRFQRKDKKNIVRSLQKTIFELKQTSRCRQEEINKLLPQTFVLREKAAEGCLYTSFHNEVFATVSLYVRDFLIAFSGPMMLCNIQAVLSISILILDLNNAGQ